MLLTIVIDLDNAAFEDFGADEVGRILTDISERIPDPLSLSEELLLHDANGNLVGTAQITD